MLVGRDEIIHSLANQSVRRHLVTIVGPAGVGKSCVASAIAERTASRYEGGTVLVDLACVDDGQPLELALAASLGISLSSSDPTGSLIAYLSPMELLLVIDNCEHFLGPLAYITEEIIRCAPRIDMLVTSREPLRCSGEWLYRLSPLPVPADGSPVSVDQALQIPSVRLFVQSAAKSLRGFVLSEANVAAVVGICRRLDGIPLAIQLVAARVRNFSVEELARAVSHRPLSLTRGWRSANVTHHASLQAALDWTYTRLTEEEQAVFRRLAVFRGRFSMPAAIEIAGVSPKERIQVPQNLLCLAEKSLVSLDTARPQTPYHLLHLTRSYALDKLIAAGELNALLRRHAAHYCSVLSAPVQQGAPLSREEWLDRYRYALDDIRAALEWGSSDGGDPNIVALLTVASLPVIYQIFVIDESLRWINSALQVLAGSDAPSLSAQVQLHLTLFALHLHVGCQQEAAILESAQRAVDIAERIDDELLRMTARMAQIIAHLMNGNPALAVARLAQLEELAAGAREPLMGVMFDRVSAQAHHLNGDFAKSRAYAQRTLNSARQPVAAPIFYAAHTLDHKISMRVICARSAWLEGRADQGTQIANECVELARMDRRPFVLAQVLTLCACPIAFWRGDLSAAQSFTAELMQFGRRFGLGPSVDFARCCQLVLGRLAGEDTAELGVAHPANTLQLDHLCTLSDQWLSGATVARAEQGLTGWCTAEILRRDAEMMLQTGDTETVQAAEQRFRHALQVARVQGALAWEVRICISLARLQRRGAQSQFALQELEIAYEKLEGGWHDADQIQARRLLEGQTDELAV